MKTIFADYNALTESDHLRLNFPASERDMLAAGIKPNDWAWLSDGELIVGAQIANDDRYGVVGIPHWKTMVHLDDEELADEEGLWTQFQNMLSQTKTSAKTEPDNFRLVTLVEHITPHKRKINYLDLNGYFSFRRAISLNFMGETGLATQEIKEAVREQPDNPDYRFIYLELLMRHDPKRAILETDIILRDADANADDLAACISVHSAVSETLTNDEFMAEGRRILGWVERFHQAPGRDKVSKLTLVGVRLYRGLALLRMGQLELGRTALHLAHSIDPDDQTLDEASSLESFDDRARQIAANFRNRRVSLSHAA